jgi:putative FmdB family regulatory protein
MPFYEYECASCKYYLEVMQKVSDAALKKCPSCGRKTLRKLVSAPVFRLKGAGWYETDFKSDQENKRNLADKEPEPEKKAPDAKEAAAEAKPGEKPAEKTADGKAAEAKSDSKPTAEGKDTASKTATENTRARSSSRSTRKSTPKAVPKSRPKVKAARRKHR